MGSIFPNGKEGGRDAPLVEVLGEFEGVGAGAISLRDSRPIVIGIEFER